MNGAGNKLLLPLLLAIVRVQSWVVNPWVGVRGLWHQQHLYTPPVVERHITPSASTQQPAATTTTMAAVNVDKHEDITIVLDLSEGFGILCLTGEDVLRFLHNQMTNNFIDAKPGIVMEASYTTSLGRTVDLVTVFITSANEAWVLCSSNRCSDIVKSMNKYIFPLDRVKVTDRTGEKTVIQVIRGSTLPAGFGDAPAKATCRVEDGVIVADGTGLALPGYTMIAEKGEKAGKLLESMRGTMEGAVWGAQQEWEGRPYPDKELTSDVTPLEAGLWHTVSFTKGCYLGQETISKVANNHGERQRLFGFLSSAPEGAVVEGARLVTKEGTRAGVITSVLNHSPSSVLVPQSSGRTRGLAYIRKNMGGPGAKLMMDGTDVEVEVMEIPYATRTDVTTPAAAAQGGGETNGAAVQAAAKKTEETSEMKAKEAERKAKKLEEMRQKLEAFQQKQAQAKVPPQT